MEHYQRGRVAAVLKLAVVDGRGFDKLNKSLITLIPKRCDAVKVGDFRPISLVHSFGKLFSKLVANRLRTKLGDLVSFNLSAFVKGRCLHDNFLLVRQVARKLQQRKVKGVFLKLDIARDFDSLSWPFLFQVLTHLGFGVIFRS
jgi:mannosylglycoprotein endo-beta-mannosidase